MVGIEEPLGYILESLTCYHIIFDLFSDSKAIKDIIC